MAITNPMPDMPERLEAYKAAVLEIGRLMGAPADDDSKAIYRKACQVRDDFLDDLKESVQGGWTAVVESAIRIHEIRRIGVTGMGGTTYYSDRRGDRYTRMGICLHLVNSIELIQEG